MKRPLQRDTIVSETKYSCGAERAPLRQEFTGLTKHPEYLPFTSGFYDFEIQESDSLAGKIVVASKGIPKDSEILLESPLVCWPNRSSAPWASVAFCEHCLIIVAARDSVEQYNLLPHGTFCSSECETAARNSWFDIIGGHGGLRLLREYDWTINNESEGCEKSFRSILPITLEGVARVLSSITHRYVSLKTLLPQNTTSSFLLSAAIRPFERLVTPADCSHYFESNTACEILQRLLYEPMAERMSPEIAKILLSQDSVSQIFGQLALNAQRLIICGIDTPQKLPRIMQAAGIFVLQSCFNHNCEPNCIVHCNSASTITVSTTREILQGEELTLSYVNTDDTLDQRRQLLASGYLFWCQCHRCLSEEKEKLPNSIGTT